MKHEIVLVGLPGDLGGAGDGWVLNRYADSVREHRRRAAKGALIVVIDADNYGVSGRTGQLSELLEGARLDPRTASEPVAHLIPRRNIETWIRHLNGHSVDEVKDWKIAGLETLIPAAAAALHQWATNTPPQCLPSLRTGIEELKRLP